MEIEGIPRELIVLRHMYIRFGSQKLSYFSGLTPLICLDSCFLKIAMGGHLLCAIARDGNENMLPLPLHVLILNARIHGLGSSVSCVKILVGQKSMVWFSCMTNKRFELIKLLHLL